MSIHQKHCAPCSDGLEPLPGNRVGEYLTEVPGWELCVEKEVPHVSRIYKFKDFKEALAFVNKVGELAEEEGHHPDIAIHWNRVTLTLWTHVAKGLTENDFILAAKINKLSQPPA